MRVTSFSRLYTLMLLSSSPRHGYQLIKELEKGVGKKVSTAEVYPFLRELKERGYVSVESTGKGRRKRYSLTSKGRRFAGSILDDLSDVIDALVSRKIVSCTHCSCRIYGKPYLARHAGRLMPFCCIYCAKAMGEGV